MATKTTDAAKQLTYLAEGLGFPWDVLTSGAWASKQLYPTKSGSILSVFIDRRSGVRS